MAMATSSAAIAGAAARCSTTSKPRPVRGSNVRSASPRARKRRHRKRWFRRSASKTPGVRVFVVHSEERQAYERSQRDKAMARVRARLEKLARRVAKGRLKAAEKIGAAAGRILTRNHGHRYYDWTYQDGVFRFFEH